MKTEELKELGEEILRFVYGHASRLPSYDPEYDEEEDSFTSPDASIMFFIGSMFKEGKATDVYPDSSWGSGGYCPYLDGDAHRWHDKIKEKISKAQA